MVREFRLRWNRPLIRGIYAVYGLASCVVLTDEFRAGGPFPWAALAVFGVFLAALVAWGEAVLVKAGLTERPDGLCNAHQFGRELIPWSDVARFEAQRVGLKRVVYLVDHEGRSREIPSLLEGRRVVWDGGETRSIVAVLNESVRRHTMAPGAGPPGSGDGCSGPSVRETPG